MEHFKQESASTSNEAEPFNNVQWSGIRTTLLLLGGRRGVIQLGRIEFPPILSLTYSSFFWSVLHSISPELWFRRISLKFQFPVLLHIGKMVQAQRILIQPYEAAYKECLFVVFYQCAYAFGNVERNKA